MPCVAGTVAAPGLGQEAATLSSVRLPRCLALLCDLFLIGVIVFPLSNVFAVQRVTSGLPPTGQTGFAAFTTTMVLDWPWQVAIATGYFLLFEVLFRATPGKLLLGLRVVALDGARAPAADIFLRNLVRIIDALPIWYLVGGLLVLFTRRHQRLGDFAGHTRVVGRDAAPDAGRIGQRRRTMGLAVIGAVGVGLIAFSLAFAYFWRPPLVLEGLKNTGGLNFIAEGHTYTLGQPAMKGSDVTVPLRMYRADGTECDGQITLQWRGLVSGWVLGGAETRCP